MAGTKSGIGRRRKDARRTPSLEYIERRDKLHAAATEVFRTKGLDATSINDIATQMGADRATVYYYYSSKQEIFLVLVRQAVEQMVVLAESIAAAREPSTVRLRNLMQSVLQVFEQTFPILQLYIREDIRRMSSEGTSAARAEIKALGERYEAALCRITDDGKAAGEFRGDVDTRIVMLAVLGALNWTHRWFVPGGRLGGSELGQQFADVFLNGLRSPRKRAPSKRRAKT